MAAPDRSALLKQAEARLASSSLDAPSRELFLLRFARSEGDLFAPLETLYGKHPVYSF